MALLANCLDGMEEIEVPEPCDYGAARLIELKVVPHYELKAFPKAFGTAEDRWKSSQSGARPGLRRPDRRITNLLVVQQ